MPVNYPTIRPSDRTVTLGLFSVKRQSSPAGTGTTRRFGTLPFNIALDFEYGNVTDQFAYLLGAAYEASFGGYDTLILPDELWDDIEEPLRSRLRGTYVWRFAAPPVYAKSGIPGYKNVTIKLRGDRDTTIPPVVLPVITIVATDASATEPGGIIPPSPGSVPAVPKALSTIVAHTCYLDKIEFTSGSDINDFGGSGQLTFAQSGNTYTLAIGSFGTLVDPVTSFGIGLKVLDLSYVVASVERQVTTVGSVSIFDDTFFTSPPPPFLTGTVSSTYEASGSITEIRLIITIAPIPPNPGQFTLTRSGSTAAALTVNVALSGTATNGVDYSTIPSTVTFAAGSATAVVNVTPLADSVTESSETVVMTLTSGSGYTVGTSNTATLTIT